MFLSCVKKYTDILKTFAFSESSRLNKQTEMSGKNRSNFNNGLSFSTFSQRVIAEKCVRRAPQLINITSVWDSKAMGIMDISKNADKLTMTQTFGFD